MQCHDVLDQTFLGIKSGGSLPCTAPYLLTSDSTEKRFQHRDQTEARQSKRLKSVMDRMGIGTGDPFL